MGDVDMVRGSCRSAALLGAALAAMAACAGASAAPAYQTLYSFTGAGDGAAPLGALAIDARGNIYGTAQSGGLYGYGAAYRIAPDGGVTALHQFKGGRDGAVPMAGLVARNGVFYGTTQYGGVANGGTVFRLKADGYLKILHSFGVGEDGFNPASGVSFDAAGNLYGTTPLGGGASCSCGAVYKLGRDGGEAVLYAFAGGNDGSQPQAGVTLDGAGNMFGTTWRGGASDKGTVFSLAPDGSESVLHAFLNQRGSGANPLAGVVRDAQGNLYGSTTSNGGIETGTIFEVEPNGNTVKLHSMGGTDGYLPTAGDLVRDAKGNLYGTAQLGGSQNCGFGEGCGTIFRVAPGGKLTVLHFFGGGTDGYWPQSGLVADEHGALYGTTTLGGASGHGTIFKISN